MDEFTAVISSVRTFPYKARPKRKINWASYYEAQEHEYPLGLIKNVVDEAANSYKLVRHDATGKSGYSADDIAKMLLAQQYEGRSDRVTVDLRRNLILPID